MVANFDQALGLIASAVEGDRSKAAYLHGSFGSGKSHFMAVLHALLNGAPQARSRDELAGVLARHDVWLSGRKFLLVPFHLLGAKSLEQKVLGGYAEYVRTRHPDAPVPAVHRTDAMLDDARMLRANVGDETFVAVLSGAGTEGSGTEGRGTDGRGTDGRGTDGRGSGGGGSHGSGAAGDGEDDEWGEPDPDTTWTPAKLDAAFAAGHTDPLRRRLVSDLLQTWQKGFFQSALEGETAFVSLDRGLTEIAGHAKALGYDGLVLFLDELILWLANSMGDQTFVSREVQKITNFVEGGGARRPVPVVSFIARQRDLRELVGDDVAGDARLGFLDTLKLAQGRFDTITLEDRNLPVIAHQRLLKPISAEAAKALDDAFTATSRMRGDVWDALLGGSGAGGGSGGADAFRLTYPFSPAFMDTLVYVSSALQRSRTALKLMRQLLVDHRDDLRLGQLVPFGDLYDVISRGGDQPFTEKLKVEFAAAQKLYETKLRPYLLEQNGLTEDDVAAARGRVAAAGAVDPRTAARVKVFTGDDRLMKTLLLSALAPSVPALRNLTARRLSALNHGTITSPIPGQEASRVSTKVETWASQFGEITFTRADDPGVGLELVGVDVDSVLATAGHYDGIHAREALVKRLLWDELGVTDTGEFVATAKLNWRGSERSVEVVYGNIRDRAKLGDEAFTPLEATSWRIVVDYPFDEGSYGSADDRNRVDKLLEAGVEERTVCWIPASFTAERLGDLRLLVILNQLLSGQRFDSHAKHLTPDDRQRARTVLEGQHETLLGKMRGVLRQAYGLAQKQATDTDVAFADHLLSLSPDLPRPTLPFGASMADALRRIADDMLGQQFPAHPNFDPDRVGALVRAADAKLVLGYARTAADAGNPRVEVVKGDRVTMRRVAEAAGLGRMHESAFVFDRSWVNHFERTPRNAVGELTVAALVRRTDEPDRRGLDPRVAHLLIACFAEQTDRVWTRGGTAIAPPSDLAKIPSDLALREQTLPEPEVWNRARDRAARIFGLAVPELRRGRVVREAAGRLSEAAHALLPSSRALVAELEANADLLGLDLRAPTGRLVTARRGRDLLETLDDPRGGIALVTALAKAELGGPADRLGRSVKSAGQVVAALSSTPWDSIEMIAGLGEEFQARSKVILDGLRGVAAADELTASLPDALAAARLAATRLATEAIRKPSPSPSPSPAPPQPPPPVRPAPLPPTPGTMPMPGPGSAEVKDSPALEIPGEPVIPQPGTVSRSWMVGQGDLDEAVTALRSLVADSDGVLEITWRPSP